MLHRLRSPCSPISSAAVPGGLPSVQPIRHLTKSDISPDRRPAASIHQTTPCWSFRASSAGSSHPRLHDGMVRLVFQYLETSGNHPAGWTVAVSVTPTSGYLQQDP